MSFPLKSVPATFVNFDDGAAGAGLEPVAGDPESGDPESGDGESDLEVKYQMATPKQTQKISIAIPPKIKGVDEPIYYYSRKLNGVQWVV